MATDRNADGVSTDDVSEDSVLGGRVRLRQLRRGHRVGHDAILLAASCPACAGDAVADLGAGVGGAGLALAVRVPGTEVTLVEVDPRLVALAGQNIGLNGVGARVRAVALNVTAGARAFEAAGLQAEHLAHVLMNPPFNDPVRQRASPDDARRLAHLAPRDLLGGWIRTAARLLRPRGTLTLIWRADGLGDVIEALGLSPAFGAVTVMPVHGQAGEPAIRVLVRATKASRGPLVLLPALMLNDAAGCISPEAEAVLRGGQPLRLADL